MRIAVVGAGPSGLVTLYTIQKRLAEKISGLEMVAFERGEEIGGEWVFPGEKPERYEQDLPMNSSLYNGLQINGPREQASIHPDFPWPPGTPRYPDHHQMLAHLQNFASKFDLTKYVKFSKLISNVERDNDSDRLAVTVTNLINRETSTELFDYVFLCSGQHRKPFIPPDVDTSQFSGSALHYHDLRDPARFYGKRVVVVGALFGAADIVICLANKASALYLSYNRHKPFWLEKQLPGVEMKPKLQKAVGNTAYFSDGSTAEVDAIIYATGFQQFHPLGGELDLDFNSNTVLFPLYKHTVHPACNSVFFIGKAYCFVIQLARLQAEFACAVVDGRVELPSREEMLEDINSFQLRWAPDLMNCFDDDADITTYFPVAELEIEIANFLADAAQSPRMAPFVLPLIYQVFRNLRDDLLHYRQLPLPQFPAIEFGQTKNLQDVLQNLKNDQNKTEIK